MSGAVDEHFKANRDWLAQSFVYALAETAVMLSLAFLVVGTSNFVSGRFLGFQTWFAACMLLAWMMWFVMPQIPLEVCSFAPQVPSGRVWLFVVGIAGVAVFCWLGNVLSMENLKVGDGVSWLRASHYALALPLQEELLFRGIVFLGLLKRAPSRRRLCVALSGVSFAVMHLPNTEVLIHQRKRGKQVIFLFLAGLCRIPRGSGVV
jgi:membrane protease YdiL (CAAX protease family)